MRYITSIALFIVLTKPLASQNWEAISAKPDRALNFLWRDTVDNFLYGSGINCDKFGFDSTYHLVKYNGYEWKPVKRGLIGSYLSSPQGSLVYCATHYKNNILFAGDFYGADTIRQRCIISYDRNNFKRFQPEPFKKKQYSLYVNNLNVIDDTLYICGAFDTIQGKPAKGFAKLVGNQWIPINLGTLDQSFTWKVLKYKNELYVVGQFYNNPFNDGYAYILKQQNGAWVSVGGGLKGGGVNWIYSAIVYKDELYVCGYFFKAAGNHGHNIQKWNGTTWSDVGITNDTATHLYRGMKIIDDKLYCYGSLITVGDGSIPAQSGVAVWDGTSWCSRSKDVFQDVTITAIEEYNGKLIVAGNFNAINGNTDINHLARLKCDDFCADTCKYEIPPAYADNFNIFPNPSNGLFTINANGYVPNNATIKLYNALGQKIIDSEFTATINLQNYASGLYYLQIDMANKKWSYKLVVE